MYNKKRDQLGENYYIVLETMFHTALECKQWAVARIVESILYKEFQDDPKVLRNNASLLNAIGKRQNSKNLFKKMGDQNLFDFDAVKRRISILREEDNITQLIEELNEYLKKNIMDKEAWLELGDVYMEYMNYEKALFCFEEVLLLEPENIPNMIRIAELYYTKGRSEDNLTYARKYFCFVLTCDQNNYRALYGLKQTCKILLSLKKDNSIALELLQWAEKKIKEIKQMPKLKYD